MIVSVIGLRYLAQIKFTTQNYHATSLRDLMNRNAEMTRYYKCISYSDRNQTQIQSSTSRKDSL